MRKIFKKLLSDYDYRGFVSSSFSFLLTCIFFIYNLLLGFLYGSIWNVSISVYYFMIVFIRALILFSERKWHKNPPIEIRKKRNFLFKVICYTLILLDMGLIVPISLMVLSIRTVNFGIIPTITVATYTTYKIIIAIFNYKKTQKKSNLSLHSLKIVNLMDALVSVLTLQNTMVSTFSNAKSMMTLTAYTSAGLLVIMIFLTVLQLRKSRKL